VLNEKSIVYVLMKFVCGIVV